MKAIHHIFVFIASTFLAVLGRAQTFDYWLGSATTNAWSFASNWSMGVKPPTNGIAVFTNNSAYAYPPSFDNSDTFQALDVQGSASLLVSLANTNSPAMTLIGWATNNDILGLWMESSAGTVTMSNKVLLAAPISFRNDSANALNFNGPMNKNGFTLSLNGGGTGGFVFNASVGGGGGVSVNLTNGGSAIFNANNSYGGNTKISAGQLIIGAGSISKSILDYNNYGGTINFSTNKTVVIGALQGAQNLTLQNASTAAVTLTVGNKNAIYAGSLSGSGGFTVKGSSTQTLTGTNSYAGSTTIQNGTLNVSGSGAIIGAGTLQVGNSAAGYFQYASTATSTFGSINIGNSTAGPGTLTQSSGTINATNLTLHVTATAGAASYGVVNMIGGTMNISNTATLGAEATADLAPNSFTIGGSAVFNALAGLNLAYGKTAGRFANGHFIQNGGTVNVTNRLNLIAGNIGNFRRSQYDLNGGTLNVDQITCNSTSLTDAVTTVNFNGGTLKALANNSLFWTNNPQTTAMLMSAGAVIDDGGYAIGISQVFRGAGTLTKTNNGTLTLSGININTGATVIGGGELVGVTGSSSSNSPITILSGATNGVQILTANGQWACGGLTNTAGGTLDFNGGNVRLSTTNAPMLVNGNVTLGDNLNVIVRGNVAIPFGVFPLIKYTGTLSGTPIATNLTLPAGVTGSISNDTVHGLIDFVTLGSPTVYWQGGNGIWDINVSVNWKTNAAPAAANSTFFDGSAVIFDDTASGPSPIWVTTSATVSPITATFNQTNKNFVLYGSDIGGGAALIKNGSGTLTLSNANTYTGNTTINGGTVAVASGGAIGNSAITVNSGGTLTMSGGSISSPSITLSPGGTLSLKQVNVTLSGQPLNITATGSSIAVTNSVTNNKTLTLAAPGGLNFTAYGGGNTAPLLIIGGGTIALNNAPITVTTTTRLGAGTYTLVNSSGATISGTPGTLTIAGSGLAAGMMGVVSASGSQMLLTVTNATTPTISGAATASPFVTTYGTASAAQSFLIQGADLAANITATPATGLEVSSDGMTYGTSASFMTDGSGNVSTNIYIRLAATAAAGTYNSSSVALLSSGATSVYITTVANGNVVNPAPLTITNLVGVNKVYDGTTTASLTGTAAYSGLVNGESFSPTNTPNAVFTTANVGSNKTIVVTGYTAPSANYILTQPSPVASISALALTVTAGTDVKFYDGTITTTNVPAITGTLQGSDTANFIVTYDTKNNGTNKMLTPSGSVNDGNGGANYSYTFVTSANGTIYKTNITVTAQDDLKYYDGTTASSLLPTTSVDVTLFGDMNNFSQTFDSKNVGTSKSLIPSGTVTDAGGNASTNYTYTFANSNGGEIDQNPNLTINAVANTKIYDGTTSAAAVPAGVGLQPGDTVTGAEVYADRNVGTGKTLNVSTYIISDGNGGANYYSPVVVPFTGGVITATNLTITAQVNVKNYDGTTNSATTATITFGGIQTGDSTPIWTQFYANKNVGTNKTLTPADVTRLFWTA